MHATIPRVSKCNSISSVASNNQLLTSYYKSTYAAASWSADPDRRSLYSDRYPKISETWFKLRSCLRLHWKNQVTFTAKEILYQIVLSSSWMAFKRYSTLDLFLPDKSTSTVHTAKTCLNWLNIFFISRSQYQNKRIKRQWFVETSNSPSSQLSTNLNATELCQLNLSWI